MTRISMARVGGMAAVFVGVATLGCGQTSDDGASDQNALRDGGTDSSPGSGGKGGGGGSGGSGQGGSGGVTVAPFFCGEETCTGDQKCCPATGRCYGPNDATGCIGIGCAVAGGGVPDPSCCPSGLALCAATSSCYHPGCEGCCAEPVACEQHSDCPAGTPCCFSSRTCMHPALGDCSTAPPPCASDGSCPGDMVCCEQHGICYEPGCTDCCPNECAPQTAHCGQGMPCCAGLDCCSGVPVPPGAEYCGTTCPISDRNAKHAVVSVDPEAVLQSVAALNISEWSYKDDASNARHIGPMAQDFRAAFGTGDSERCIPTVDSNGVALAAIQALYQRVQRIDSETSQLRAENAALRRKLEQLSQQQR